MQPWFRRRTDYGGAESLGGQTYRTLRGTAAVPVHVPPNEQVADDSDHEEIVRRTKEVNRQLPNLDDFSDSEEDEHETEASEPEPELVRGIVLLRVVCPQAHLRLSKNCLVLLALRNISEVAKQLSMSIARYCASLIRRTHQCRDAR